jgi:methylenetetrahydrofolate dehydrogenase (NADP+)/methenyltetrahydrofolate cyclohydrolase
MQPKVKKLLHKLSTFYKLNESILFLIFSRNFLHFVFNFSDHLKDIINILNKNSLFHGIVLQLPLPSKLSPHFYEIIDCITKQKDIDCISTENYNNISSYNHDSNIINNIIKNFQNTPENRWTSHSGLYPCTTLSIDQMIQIYQISCFKKNVVILGSSYLVGKPISKYFIRKGSYAYSCDVTTPNIKELIKNADILVTCTGSEIRLLPEDIKEDLVLFDVGINIGSKSKKIQGDVDVSLIKHKLKYYSPVPGGLGPLTVANMILNLYNSFLKIEHEKCFRFD